MTASLGSGRGRGAGPIVALTAVVLLPALALFGLWRFADGRRDAGPDVSIPPTTVAPATSATPAAALATPLLSFRRVPGLVARDLNAGAFAQQVGAFANTLGSTSCLVVELDGVEVGSHNPDVPVIPASNQKLLTAAAALHVLGSDHRFTTEAWATGASGGVVDGDLYLVGGGDPLLTSSDYDSSRFTGYPIDQPTVLDELARQIAAAGITEIRGGVVGDGSRYDDEFFVSSWSEDAHVTEGGPFDALLVNDARALGSDWYVADDPNVGAAAELTRLLEANGVSVAGDPSAGTKPADATSVATIQSEPLPAAIAEMMSSSDNNTAEMLLKEMGVAAGGAGTTAAGAAAMTVALQELGIDTTGLVIADGSGLSNDNRVTCRAISDVLALHGPGDDFARGLPVAGETGTLSDAFVDTPMQGVMIAKTGSLGNPPYNQDPPAVKALSGYVPVDGGGVIEFSLILNDPSQNVADQSVNRPVWDALGNVLATYPSGPSAADLGPA